MRRLPIASPAPRADLELSAIHLWNFRELFSSAARDPYPSFDALPRLGGLIFPQRLIDDFRDRLDGPHA